MSRLGLHASDVTRLANAPELLGSIEIDYVMTHLACSDQLDHQYNAEQLARFSALLTLLPPLRTSIGTTSGAFLGKKFHGDLVRAGIGLYGGNPQPGNVNPMHEVVQIQGQVLQVQTVELVSGVGYGATVQVRPPTRLATIAFGYADGYPRSLSNGASAMIGSYPAAVLGRISMDTLVLDVSGIPTDKVEEGAWVTLVGSGVDLDGLAAKAGTISYELLSGIGRRVARQYV
jgi:alanine racemase